jgi:hypothetical protein
MMILGSGSNWLPGANMHEQHHGNGRLEEGAPDEHVAWDSGAEHGENLLGIYQETPRRFLATAESAISRRMGFNSMRRLVQTLILEETTSDKSSERFAITVSWYLVGEQGP